MRSQFQRKNQESHLEFSVRMSCMFQNFHDLSVKQVSHLIFNRKLFPSLGIQKESKGSVGFLCIQVGEDNSPLRWRPEGKPH